MHAPGDVEVTIEATTEATVEATTPAALPTADGCGGLPSEPGAGSSAASRAGAGAGAGAGLSAGSGAGLGIAEEVVVTTAPHFFESATGPYRVGLTMKVQQTPGLFPRPPSYTSRAVQFHPHGGQSDFIWLSTRTPHRAYVW